MLTLKLAKSITLALDWLAERERVTRSELVRRLLLREVLSSEELPQYLRKPLTRPGRKTRD